MPTQDNKTVKYHLKANASFAIREGWLTKGLRHVSETPDVFLREDAIDALGVGSAMVKSIRYWMQAAGLSVEPRSGRRIQTLTELGEKIREYDLYFEDYFSLYLVHYGLASNMELSPVLYLFYNELSLQRFTRDTMIDMMLLLFKEKTVGDFSEKSFKDDCATLLRTYVAEPGKQMSPEDNMQCPLVSLGLLDRTARNMYEKTSPPPSKLHPMAILYVMLDRMQGREEISIERLLNEPNNVGKIFNLNLFRLNSYLDQLQANRYLKIMRTAGLNMVYLEPTLKPIDVVDRYYRR